MSSNTTIDELLAHLNPEQREAATHGDGPLLIVAGAGTGKTATLVHRVAWLIAQGVDPGRILLLTFTRRAAAEMLRRSDLLLHRLHRRGTTRVWGGTYHAIATRLLHRYGKAVGLPPSFSVYDRPDSEDLLNVVRTELNLAKTDKRFPKKGTCMAIYSRCVNACEKLDDVLPGHFPWCKNWTEELRRLFDGYVDRKEAGGILDYDDLLLYWRALLADAKAGDAVRRLFDCVLVDEYQDTNALQAEIIYVLSPEGKGLTAVGDDAQSIYAFRAATVRNILNFPQHYRDHTIVTLEQNYRSTQPILEATNRVIGLAAERYTKNLWSQRVDGQRPRLVNCEDESDQAEYVIRRILEHREEGIDLRRQAVLFRASHHSMMLEAELARASIPFHKYGGLKFIETGHVKDLMAFLRLAENPRDVVSASRLLVLLPGVGPGKARQLIGRLIEAGGDFRAWADWKPPAGAATSWPAMIALLEWLARTSEHLPAQVHRVAHVVCTAVGGEIRSCRAQAPRPRTVGDHRLALPEPRSDAAGDDARPAQFDPGLRRSADAGRRLPGAQHDPFGQGLGVGRRVRDSRRGREHSVGHGDGPAGRHRGRAAALLRRPDARQALAVRVLSVALLLAGPKRPLWLRAADPFSSERSGGLFRAVRQHAGRGRLGTGIRAWRSLERSSTGEGLVEVNSVKRNGPSPKGRGETSSSRCLFPREEETLTSDAANA